MEFLNFIVEYFKNYEVSVEHIVGDVLMLAVFLASFIFVFCYTDKHDAKRFYTITGILLLAMFLLVALGVVKSAFIPVLVVIAIILSTVSLFKNDIRRDLYKISIKTKEAEADIIKVSEEEARKCVNMIVKSCQTMSKSETGALIIISPYQVSDSIIESGTRMNADLSSQLIETVFYPKCPLHDGAMVINGTKITAAGCYLNLTQQPNLPKELGTRHRAAIGITEANPTVLAIVVSEESGIISAAFDGMHVRYLDAETLTGIIEIPYGLSSVDYKTIFGGKDND
ncbi:MAG: diadenylate cyclase [Clostridia bacterium]|nr:diadenylate cyclase [Clostridia bacterium]